MKEQILEIIKNKGPTTPSELTRQLKINTMFVGAYLSELVSSKKLLISKLKVGSSPLYYADGQQEQLQNFYKNLNEKDKEAFDQLKKEGVIRDREQTPIIRVALRNIPDFSKQLNIKTNNGDKEIFWKWYMLTDTEAEELIKKSLNKDIKEKEITVEQKTLKKEEKQTEQPQKDEKDKIIEELKKQIEQNKELFKKEKEKIDEEKRKIENEKKEKPKEKQKTLKKDEKETEDKLLLKIKEYCKQKNMEIMELEILKKKIEIDLILKVPSAVGSSKYYCKAKDKKKISEGDLSSAIIKAQTKKLPAIFITTGELTTKAKKELENELKNQIIFQKI